MPRLAWILLFAAPVLAEDFETRYHEAYKLEVVDGKVADAAARYLDLLREKELPAHLKAQSEFRFAVTCALLGRPDEARARLAALAEAPGTPAALQPQIEEYRKALADMAPGSATSKRFDDLVFLLGRERTGDPGAGPAVYRDFEIMGRAAVPQLLRLLDHTDRQIKEHAFRILCRMNEPGLAARWDSSWQSTVFDFRKYLTDRPEEMAILEQRLAAMPPNATDVILYASTGSPWSATFLKAHAERGGSIDAVVKAVGYRQDDEAKRVLLATWVKEGPDAFAVPATDLLVRYGGKWFDPGLFPIVCGRLARSDVGGGGLGAVAAAQSTDTLLDALAALLDGKDLPEFDSVAGLVASVAARRAIDAKEAVRLAGLLDRWMSRSRPSADVLRACVERLPAEEAARLVAKWFAGQQAGSVDLIALKRPEDVALLAAAIGAMAPEGRRKFLNQVFSSIRRVDRPGMPATSPETLLALLRLLPSFRGKIEADDLANYTRHLAPGVPAEEAIGLVTDFLRKDASLPVCDTFFRSGWQSAEDRAYRNSIAVPALPRAWDLIPAGARSGVIASGVFMLDEKEPRALDVGPKKDLAAFLRPRLREMGHAHGMGAYPIIVRYPELFPLEEWLPMSPQSLWESYPPFGGAIDQERLDRAARALVGMDPAKVTDTVLTFVENCVSGEVMAGCAAELYRRADADLLRMLLSHRRLMPPDAAVLEETFDRLKDADLSVIARLGYRLAEVRPSEKLFKLAERLLASPDRGFVLEGIELARSLGRDEMLQALLGKLDSMDAEVRTKAREAIDSILELKRIKDEVSQRIAESK